MEILFLWLRTVWVSARRQATAIGVAILAVVGLIAGHRRKVSRAETAGRKEGERQERERIQQETKKVEQRMEERANEVRADTADIDDHELADRLRTQRDRIRNR